MANALVALRAAHEGEARARMTHDAWAPPEELGRARKWLTGPVATDDYGNEIPRDSSSLLSMLNSLTPHPGQSEEQIAQNIANMYMLRGGPPVVRGVDTAIGEVNKGLAGVGRAERPVAITSEAVGPGHLQLGTATRAEQELYGNKLYEAARQHAGLPADAKTHDGWGAWGTEHNPLKVETYRPGGTDHLENNALVRGPAESLANNLLQEGVGAHRWNPLPLNRRKDATAIMVKLPKNASREMVEALNKKYGDSMVIAHRPDTNSVFLTPFDGKGPMPSRADLDALLPGSKVRYGRADPNRDATLITRSKDPGPMPSDVWDVYSELDYRNLVETR